jgi:hypothetical protein
MRVGWLGLAAGAVGGVLVALTSQGCTIVTSDAPLDGGDFDGDFNNDSGGATGCNECLFDQCAGNWTVCQNNTECRAIYTCATAPNIDQAGVNACFCAHPAGQNAYVALAACDSVYSCGSCKSACNTAASSCTSPGVIVRDLCGSSPPPDAGTGADTGVVTDDAAPPPPNDASLPPTDAAVVQDCTSCTASKCSTEKAACASGSECETYTLCLAACQDAACFTKCATDHADGKTASEKLETCTLNSCKDECGL